MDIGISVSYVDLLKGLYNLIGLTSWDVSGAMTANRQDTGPEVLGDDTTIG